MARHPLPSNMSDRQESLRVQDQEVSAELERLTREEEYLRRQVAKAEEQLAYYEGLLADLRRTSRPRSGLRELLRQF